MKPFIFGKRNLIHVIDLRETVRGLVVARKYVEQVCGQGQEILFVGTKNQAKNAVRNQAGRCGMHYVNERWLGGTLTNFRTIRSRLTRLQELENMEQSGQMALFSKKMIATLTREKEKIQQNLEGIRNMERLPGVLVVIDPRREKNAVAEANKLGIPIVALTDTDCDPTRIDIVIPGNDDAMRAGEIVCAIVADAALAGKTKAPQAALDAAKTPLEAEPERETKREDTGRSRRQRRPRAEPQKRLQVRRAAPVAQAEEPPAEDGPAPDAEAKPEGGTPAQPEEGKAEAAEAPAEPQAEPAAPEAEKPEPEPQPEQPAQDAAPSDEPSSGKS